MALSSIRHYLSPFLAPFKQEVLAMNTRLTHKTRSLYWWRDLVLLLLHLLLLLLLLTPPAGVRARPLAAEDVKRAAVRVRVRVPLVLGDDVGPHELRRPQAQRVDARPLLLWRRRRWRWRWL